MTDQHKRPQDPNQLAKSIIARDPVDLDQQLVSRHYVTSIGAENRETPKWMKVRSPSVSVVAAHSLFLDTPLRLELSLLQQS